MEQTVYNGTVHQHMEGTGFQTRFVPAEKPYAVYGFVLYGRFRAAQQIGTMIEAAKNDKGLIEYHSKPVWRIQTPFLDPRYEAYVDNGDIDADTILIGMQGEKADYDTLLEQMENARSYDEDLNPNEMVSTIRAAGIDIDLSEEVKQRDFVNLRGAVQYEPRYTGKNYEKVMEQYFLQVSGNVVMWIRLDIRPHQVMSDMLTALDNWRKFGMGEFGIRMESDDEVYQSMIDELLCVAEIYRVFRDRLSKMDGSRFGPWIIIEICSKLGVRKCMQDDILTAMQSYQNDYTAADAEQLTEHLLATGAAERRGNIVEFSEDFYRMISWKFAKLKEY